MQPVTGISILYDGDCGLCTRTKQWIMQQTPLVKIEMIDAGSAEAKSRFFGLRQGELAVIGNTGEVWLGNQAWLVCLWALRDYRALSLRLKSPLLLSLARQAFDVVSRNRSALSEFLNLRSEREMEQRLRKVSHPECQAEAK
jgi:predicted DCC family thiol-disulfide oxidoreductase YuxK